MNSIFSIIKIDKESDSSCCQPSNAIIKMIDRPGAQFETNRSQNKWVRYEHKPWFVIRDAQRPAHRI